jgi:hypothetical protein
MALKRYPTKGLDGEPITKTAPEQANELNNIRNNLGLDYIYSLWLTDSEPVQIATIKDDLEEAHLPCLAHKLNTVLQTFFNPTKKLCPLKIINSIKSCKGIVSQSLQEKHRFWMDTTVCVHMCQ